MLMVSMIRGMMSMMIMTIKNDKYIDNVIDDDNVIDGMRLWAGRMVLLGGAWRLLGDGSPHFKPGFLHSHDR